MREHMGLYRGKRTDNGEWVEGFYAYFKDLYKDRETYRIYKPFAESDCGEFYPDWYEIDPDTVGECTGLRDKNGKLIFEGDIVLDTDEPCKIVFENCCWKEIFQGDWWSFIYDDDEVEIIGNVADNPELLKGGEG